ncbi:inorganic phosphate transporter [Paracoccus aurantiacus]|uniref:Phosphate transporter n=1 Tax=Paracoccus aurantiacus TaxID=2599412 RepID=A0A5C6S0A0_9RHOB|nr:inorganic phosphate transporter [Paracoccus aurantiacus]TXB68078.1 inorganic phosphate transporter [Paracoccus aurantiacus]
MFRPMQQGRDFRILDKDLDRLGHAEGAGRVASRPLRRMGLLMGMVLSVIMIAAFAGMSMPGHAALIAGFSVALYLGLNIGANDVANSAGAAIGARTLPVGLGLALVAAAQLAGALLAGDTVTQTIARDILALGRIAPDAHPGRIMAAALVGAGIWITLANWARAPVSTTHSVIGAVAGAGMAGLGTAAIDWQVVAGIALGWMIAPVASAMLAAALLGLLRWRVHFAADPRRSARLWLPSLIGATATIFALYLLTLTAHQMPPIGAFAACLSLGIIAFVIARAQLDRQIAAERPEDLALKNLLSVPLIATAILSGFAHGANDVANVAGPLSVMLSDIDASALPLWVLGLSGLSVAAGSLIFGRRLVRMVGSSVTRLNPVRAFCASLAAAATVLACSAAGLPVSTTHCAVGGIFGVGFYREWEDRARKKTRKSLPPEEQRRRRLVRRSHVWTTLAAWAVTVPGSGCVAAASYAVFSLAG